MSMTIEDIEQSDESVWKVLTSKPAIPKFIEWCVEEADRDKQYNKSQIADDSPMGITTVQKYIHFLVDYNILIESDGKISLYQVNQYSTIINSIERMNEIQT